MTTFESELRDRILVVDGAMGTMLHAAGNSLDLVLPELNVTRPELVLAVHASYLAAGVDIIETNTWGANCENLASKDPALSVQAVNTAGARIADEARQSVDRTIYVAGSVSPAVTPRHRRAHAPGNRAATIRQQVEALVEGGVDLIVFETFGYLDELVEAVETASAVGGVPVIAQATFSPDGRTLGGESPRSVAQALSDLPVTALGANCTLGPQGLLGVIAELCKETALPVSALPNAGLPRRASDGRFEYRVDGEYLARYAARYVGAGARLVGGCCGTTPDHLQAMVSEVGGLPTAPSAGGTLLLPARAVTGSRVSSSNPSSDLAATFEAAEFGVMYELPQEASGDADQALALAEAARGAGVDLFMVPSGGLNRPSLSSTSLALHLKGALSCDVIAAVTTWDKTIMALQADLLGAHALGLRTVVCETGLPPLHGDYPDADGIWDVDSVGLISLLNSLNSGRDSSGVRLATSTWFHVGARCNSEADDLDAEVARVRTKLDAGAEFLVSRPVHDVDRLRELVSALGGSRPPLLMTVAPFGSFDEADYVAHEVPDTRVPPALLDKLRHAGEDASDVGTAAAVECLERARTYVQGVVISTTDPIALGRLASLANRSRERTTSP